MMKQDVLRVIVASLVGVAIGGAIAAVALAVVDIPTQITQVQEPGVDSSFVPATPMQMVQNTIGLAIMGAMLGVMAGGPVFAAVGLPLHGMLVKMGKTGLITYALMGALVSGVMVSITQAGMSGLGHLLNPSRWADVFGLAPWFALAGAITTTVFWLIRRPDRIAPTA